MNTDKEEWRDVLGYEGFYQVSESGKVRSLDRHVNCNGGKRLCVGKEIATSFNNSKYEMVVLYNKQKCSLECVHVLVAESFCGHIRNGRKIVVDHIDNNPKNNHYTNLQTITQRENLTKEAKGASKLRGVFIDNRCTHKKWRASITIKGKRKYLGYFYTEEEASQAYEKALKELL